MELHELPFDELRIVGIERTCESAPVGQESEPAPVIVLIYVIEEFNDRQRILHLGDVLICAAVPLEIIYGTLVPSGDPPVKADSSITGSVGSYGEENVVACHTLVPCNGVKVSVSSQVSDMQVSRYSGVCEDSHEFRLTIVPFRLVQTCFYPAGLPFLLHRSVIVCHTVSLLMMWLGIRRLLIYFLYNRGET